MMNLIKTVLIFVLLFVESASAKNRQETTPNCIMQQEITYCTDEENKAFTGRYEKRNTAGQLLSVENYRDGYMDGLATYWTEKGKLRERLYFKRGIKNGMDKVYHQNRTIKYLLNYDEGDLDGQADIYDTEGRLRGRLYYKKGLLQRGFCVGDNNKKITLKSDKIRSYAPNQLETCGVQ